jgi:hypothetical protein
MPVKYSDTEITDMRLKFVNGVAAIDIMTLHRAGEAVDGLGFAIQLPTMANVVLPSVFDELCDISASVSPAGTIGVIATIDTSKMSWALDGQAVFSDDFTDYAGRERYGVTFNRKHEAALVDGTAVAHVPVRLANGHDLTLWFAEISEADLRSTGYYALHAKAHSLTTAFATSQQRHFDWITVPAQQIKWARSMDELLPVNQPLVDTILQKVYMALDETGVRVKAVTMIDVGCAPAWNHSTSYAFGERGPVVMWLTQPGSDLPFAVIATTSEAWLSPGAQVAFDDSAFTD